MPISRVRSVTVTSMMFMMPMPPTIRLTPAMPASRKEKISVASARALKKVLRSKMAKSLSRPGRIPCARRSTRSMSTIACSIVADGATSTLIDCSWSLPVSR